MLAQRRRRWHSIKPTSWSAGSFAFAAATESSGEMPPSAGFRQDALLVEHGQSMVAIVGFSGLDVRPSDLRAAKY